MLRLTAEQLFVPDEKKEERDQRDEEDEKCKEANAATYEL